MVDFIRRNLDSNGDVKVGDFVTDKDVILLAVKSRLEFFKGEWFLDVEDGTPYFQDILKKPARLGVIEGIIKRRILETPGITGLVTGGFNMDFVPETRKLNIAFEAIDQYDNSVSIETTV